MKMRKDWVLSLFVFVTFLLLILKMPLVSAYIDLRESSQQVMGWTKDIFGPVLSAIIGTPETNEYFFAYVLLLVLIYIIVLTILSKVELFEGKKGVLVIIAMIVSLLSVHYLSKNEFINGILLPYQTLGIALSSFIPFLIYFFFVEKSVTNRGMRVFAWLLFAVIFLGLWIKRSDELGVMNWIYGVMVALSLIIIFIDPRIQKYFIKQRINRMGDGVLRREYINLMNRYYNALEAREKARNAGNKTGIKAADKEINEIKKGLMKLEKEIKF